MLRIPWLSRRLVSENRRMNTPSRALMLFNRCLASSRLMNPSINLKYHVRVQVLAFNLLFNPDYFWLSECFGNSQCHTTLCLIRTTMALYQDDQDFTTHPSAQYGCRWRSIKMINILYYSPLGPVWL